MTDSKKQPFFTPGPQQTPHQPAAPSSIRSPLPYNGQKPMQPHNMQGHHRYPPTQIMHPQSEIHHDKSVQPNYAQQNQSNVQHDHIHGRDGNMQHGNQIHHGYQAHMGRMYNAQQSSAFFNHEKQFARMQQMPQQNYQQYSNSSLPKKTQIDGQQMDQNYNPNLQHRSSPSQMLDQHAVQPNHYIPNYHHGPIRQHHDNPNGHVKITKIYDQHFSNQENHTEQHYQSNAAYQHSQQMRTPNKYQIATQQSFHQPQQIPMQPQQAMQQQQTIQAQNSQHAYPHSRSFQQSQMQMQPSNGHPGSMPNSMQMHQNNYATSSINEHQSKKRSYNNMMAQSPSHDISNGPQQDEGSETQSLDPIKDDEFDEIPCAAPEMSDNEQSLHVRSGPKNEPDQQSRQNEPIVNIDHYNNNNQRNGQLSDMNQRIKKNNQNSSKSPSPTDPQNEKQSPFINRNTLKHSKSKYSPPSRIKDNRSLLKEPIQKNNNVKRSQTGLKKLKTDNHMNEQYRKSHSSDNEDHSRKSAGEVSSKDKDADGTISNNSGKNTNQQDKTSLKRNYYSREPPLNSRKDAVNSPRKKGGNKLGTTSSNGLIGSRVNRSRYNGRVMDNEVKKRSPTQQKMEDKPKIDDDSDSCNDGTISAEDLNKCHKYKDQQQMMQQNQTNISTRVQNQKQKKLNEKSNNQISHMNSNGNCNYQTNLPVTSDQNAPKRNIYENDKRTSKQMISSKPEMSDNSGQNDKMPQKKHCKPAAPVSLPAYSDLRKIAEEKDKYQMRKTPQNLKSNQNSTRQNKFNGKENVIKSDSSEHSEKSEQKKDNKIKPGRQSERQKKMRNGNYLNRNIQSDNSDSSSPSSNLNQYKTRRNQGKGVMATNTNRGLRVLTNSSTRVVNHEDNFNNQRSGRVTRQAYKGTQSPQSTQNYQGRSPQSIKGHSSNKDRSPQQTRNQQRSLSKTRGKIPLVQKQQDKSKKSQVLKKSEKEILKILKLYFEYVCSEMISSRKIAEIQLGKIISKTTFEQQKVIEIKVANICFNQYTQRQDKEMRALSSQRSNSMHKVSPLARSGNLRTKGNESKSYGKDFGIGTIIDLTQQKAKDKANLYLIYEICVSLDFNGKGKTDKVDEELPDIEIKFKVHPIIQNYTMKAFKESLLAQEYIQQNIDEEYALDKNSLVCLFEIGNRVINDDRLIFENFVMNFQQVQKSYQLIPNDCDQFQSKVRMCRHQNTLVNSTNYEKAYLIEYGYKYEHPNQIYTLTPNFLTKGQNQNIGSKSQQNKSNSRSNGRKNQKYQDDLSSNQYKLNIKPYNKKKQATSSTSKISFKSKAQNGQPQESENSDEDEIPSKSINQRQRAPIQSKRIIQKSQRSIEADQINQNKEINQQPKRDGIRTRNQAHDFVPNSPQTKNQSFDSQTQRKKRYHAKEDERFEKNNMNEMLDVITQRKNNGSKYVAPRSSSRRQQKQIQVHEKSNARQRRYLNRDQTQKYDQQVNQHYISKIDHKGKQDYLSQEREQSQTISEENEEQFIDNKKPVQQEREVSKKLKAEKQKFIENQEFKENSIDQSSQHISPRHYSQRIRKKAVQDNNYEDAKSNSSKSNSESDNNMQIDQVASEDKLDKKSLENNQKLNKTPTTFINRGNGRRKINQRQSNDLDESNNNQTKIIIGINKNKQEFTVSSHLNTQTQNIENSSQLNCQIEEEDSQHIQSQNAQGFQSANSYKQEEDKKSIKSSSSNSSQVAIKRRQRRRNVIKANSPVKEADNEDDSNESMRAESDDANKVTKSKLRNNLKNKISDHNDDQFSVDEEESSEHYQASRKNTRRSRTAVSKQKTVNNHSQKNQVIGSQMTTRRNRQAKSNKVLKSSSEDAKSNDNSDIDNDEEDDVSQILMPNGNEKKKHEFANEYDESCYKLQLSSIPQNFPCREQEQKQIIDYLTQGVQNKGSSSSLYISGMPGTGKTSTTLEVIKRLLKSQQGRGNHNKFDFIHINAMSLSNPNLVYTILAEKIIGRRMNPQSAALFLDDFFKKKDKLSIVQRQLNNNKRSQNLKKAQQQAQQIANRIRVLLVDELDALITQKQQLLYNLFEWPCNSNSRLLVISIANTMNLPERLQQKIQSRIGNNRLVYKPYNNDQIQTILESRLKGIKVIQPKSIQIISKKVAQYSGDMRRSLQITKRAVEICRDEFSQRIRELPPRLQKNEPLQQVDIDHVVAAFEESSNSNLVNVMRGLRKFEVLVLISLVLVQKEEKVSLELVQERTDTIISAMIDHEGKKQAAMSKNNMFSRNVDDADDNLEDDILPQEDRQLIEYQNWRFCRMTTSMFREIVKRLQAFGLINLTVEAHKLCDNAFVSHFNFFDLTDLRNAFYNNEIYKVQQKFIQASQKF